MSNAVSMAAARNVEVNIQGIAERLKTQNAELEKCEAALVPSAIVDIEEGLRDAGRRVEILRKTGLVSPQQNESMNDLATIQQDMLERVQIAVDKTIEGIRTNFLRARYELTQTKQEMPDAHNRYANVFHILKQIQERSAAIQEILPNLRQGLALQDSIRRLSQIDDAVKPLQSQAQARMDDIRKRSTFSVEGRDDLRLPDDVHSLIGSFQGVHFHELNTLSKNDETIPKGYQRTFEKTVYAFQNDKELTKDERLAIVNAYLSLSPFEKDRIIFCG